jgi:integrase
VRLDAKTIGQLVLPAGKSDVIHFDDELAGFGFRLRRSGDKVRRSFVVQYRRGRRTRRVMLGPAETMTPDVARKAARKLLGAVWTGDDPQAERQAKRDREEHTFRKVVVDYIEARRDEWRGRSGSEIERYLTGSYFKPLHNKPIGEIERADVNACARTMKRDNGTVATLRALTALQSMLTWAIREGLIDSNPANNVNKPAAVPPRDRVLDDRELAAVWRACEGEAAAVTRLLILLAGRRAEVGGLRWSELDLQGGTWTLPKQRSKNGVAHAWPLPRLALSIIEGVPRVADKDTLFGERSEQGFTRWWQAKLELDERLSNAVKPWRFHDLRRSAATGMANLGVQPHVIECVLNHQSGFRSGVAAVYNKSPYMNEMRAALALWADHIHSIVEDGERRVIPLRREQA